MHRGMTTILEVITGFGIIASLVYYVAAMIAARRFAVRAQQPPPPRPKILPRVAILKPLRGRGERLLSNLTSYLELDYPRAEYFFAVSGYDDRAAEVPCILRAQYKFRPMTMVVGPSACSNKKVGKLVRMAERATKAQIFILSDADISVERDHLQRLVSELCADDKIGIVTCAYRANHAGSLASRLEALFINTDFAPQVMLSEAIEPMRYAFGATIGIKREALDAIGGFERLKNLLADDYHLGRLVTEAGYQVRLSSSIVTTASEEQHFRDFWHRQLRWARTFRTTRPFSLATIFIHGPFWALLFLLASGFSLLSFAALVLVAATRVAMSRYMLCSVLGLPEQANEAWLAPIKDLLMTAIWFASLAGNEVEWGGRRLRILRGGIMREVNG